MTIDRRTFAAASLAGAATLVLPWRALAQPGNAADTAVRGVLDRYYQVSIENSPQTATTLGLDTGRLAGLRAKLGDNSPAGIERDRDRQRKALAELRAIDRAALSPAGRQNYDAFVDPWTLIVASYGFGYGVDGWPAPYTLSQLTGVYRSVPDFLATQHPVETRADADAYLARLGEFARQLDHDTARARAEHAKGVIPPDFVVDRTLTQLAAATAQPAARNEMALALGAKATKAGLGAGWDERAARIIDAQVYPALRRQHALMRGVRARARADAGVWRLPEGEAFYRYALQFSTTTDMSADDIHRLGREQIADLQSQADVILKKQGLSRGSVSARLTALGKRPDQLYPNTPAGKKQLIDDLNVLTDRMRAMLPKAFGRLPRAPVEIRPVPAATEAGAPGGYYELPSLDGKRPAAFYINLRDTAEWPKLSLPTLVYHESLPGHHLQNAISFETPGLPELRKITFYSATGEGWGLYAEQLADEMGAYEGDALGRLGYLQSFLFRAGRLVTDTGLHDKRWTREQGIRAMVDATGSPESSLATEVERYCVIPGQATSYKVGQTRWVALREKAKKALGDRFDIRGFHDVTLAAGSMPLSGLERVVDDWIASRKA